MAFPTSWSRFLATRAAAHALRSAWRALTGQMAVEIEMVIELKEEPMVTENTDAQIRHVYEQWHETIKVRDIDGLMALYAEDAVFETSVHPGDPEGQDRGHPERKRRHQGVLRAGFRNPERRSRPLVSNRNVLRQRSTACLGVSARNTARRSGRPGRGNGHGGRAHRPSSRLLGWVGSRRSRVS